MLRVMTSHTLETLELITGGNLAAAPVASIVVLHGLGADGNDFVPIAQELDLDAVGPVRFVFPSAPVRPVTLNGGYEMRAWYDIHPPIGQSRREDEAGLRESCALVQGLLAENTEAAGLNTSAGIRALPQMPHAATRTEDHEEGPPDHIHEH